jgi:hypothetical protein
MNNSGQRLVTSAKAAQILNLSIQGVHYRIKNGQLKAIKENGKTLIYLDNNLFIDKDTNNKQVNELVQEKDIHIKLLKKYIKQITKQYKQEIVRLENNQEQIVSVFKSEIALLQSAFNEMKNIYTLEHPTTNKKQNDTISLEDFFLFMRTYNKSDKDIKNIILSRIQNNDKRFVYDKISNDIIIYRSDFLDLI